MEELLKEIIEGKEAYDKSNKNRYYTKGKGSKAYIVRRIDLLRDQLLELKQSL